MSGTRYDLIFFTALWEESYFLVRYFLGNKSNLLSPDGDGFGLSRDPLFKEDPALVMIEKDGFRIGVVTTEEMGGVLSAVKITQICENLLPRRVIVVGICGAYIPKKKNHVKLGSICVAKGYRYHSYGKIEGETKKFEMRDLGSIDAEIKDVTFSRLLQQLKDWKEMARSWQVEDVVLDWLRWNHKEHDVDYIPQVYVTDPTVEFVNFISGEVVVASTSYVTKVVTENRLAKKVVAFDMEAYSIAHVCRQYGIPCLTVKGISDFADDPTEDVSQSEHVSSSQNQPESDSSALRQGKGDHYRCGAIAAATAFALDCAFNEDIFPDNIDKIKKPNGDGVENCLWPHARVICPYSRSDIVLRRCLQAGENFILAPHRVSWLSRIFDDVPPNNYSASLAKLPEIVENGGFLTVFFPYSAEELISLLITEVSKSIGDQKSITAQDLKKLRKLLFLQTNRKSKPSNQKEELKKLILACNKATKELGLFKHFDTWDNGCSGSIAQPSANSRPSFCRILFFENEENMEKFADDILNCVYPALLGVNMMTFGVVARTVRLADAAVADVVFIEQAADDSPMQHKESGTANEHECGASEGNLVAMRFFLDAKTLIFTGTPCEETQRMGNGKYDIAAKSLVNLHDLWKKNHADRDMFIPLNLADALNEPASTIK